MGAFWEGRGQLKPASVWCLEPVCESGRTLFWNNAVLPSAAELEEHEKECLVSFLRPRPAAEGSVCRYYIPAAVGSMSTRIRSPFAFWCIKTMPSRRCA